MSKKTPTKFVGFDYSMTSPAMCIIGKDGLWSNSTTYFLTDKPKYAKVHSTQRGFQIIGQVHKLYATQAQRFEQIAAHFIEILRWSTEPYAIAIEDYSMGSKGKVFHIAENTGLLKYLLWKYHYDFITVPPTQIKKFATGKGNADKNMMAATFTKETEINLSKIMDQGGKLDSPVTDVVDAYYIAKYARAWYEQDSGGFKSTQS